MPAEGSTRGLTRADFEGLSCRPLREGALYKADLTVYEVGGEQILLKDYRRKRGLWRSVLGRLLTAREARALRALAGLEGVPQLRGRPDRHSVAMTHVSCRKASPQDPALGGNAEFIGELKGIVAEMHRRGVVHLDLRHRSNLRATEDDRPLVLDFESAACFNPRWFGGRLAVKALAWIDNLAVLNWTRRLCPELLSERQLRRALLLRRFRSCLFLPRKVLDLVLALARKLS